MRRRRTVYAPARPPLLPAIVAVIRRVGVRRIVAPRCVVQLLPRLDPKLVSRCDGFALQSERLVILRDLAWEFPARRPAHRTEEGAGERQGASQEQMERRSNSVFNNNIRTRARGRRLTERYVAERAPTAPRIRTSV